MDAKTQISQLLSGPLSDEGFDLIEIKLARFRKSSRLQVFIDSDNRVTIDDCARLSKMIENIIDDANIFIYGYTIEVSSPGLERPLYTAKDFRRRVGEKLQLFFNDAGISPIKGELVNADDAFIELRMDDGNKKIGLETVKMGKIIF
jgi:ribosome maturation factor RimP